VILDPHPLAHGALRTLLATINTQVVGATRSISTACKLLREHRHDLLVLEVDMPNAREQALRLIERAGREQPRLSVVVLSATDDPALIGATFDRGAKAYVLKSSEPGDIVTAFSQAFEPSLYLARPENGATAALDGMLLRTLTRRELEILRLVSGGRTNRQVAKMLFVTDQTVKFHLANVYRKLGVHSRYEAARWARRHGLAEPTETSNVVALDSASATRSGDARARPSGPASRTATGRHGSRGHGSIQVADHRRTGTPEQRTAAVQPPARLT
jgi:DNA-binding NarL/FixJ family response regulator